MPEPATAEDIRKLRGSLKAHRAAVDANTEQLERFNENISDTLVIAEQLIPLVEAAGAGNAMISGGISLVKNLLAQRKAARDSG